MAIYDHNFTTLVINNRSITGWADATDAMQINPTNAKGTLTEGGNGNHVYVGSGKRGRALVLNVLQNHPDNKFLNELSETLSNPKTYSPIMAYYKDTVNLDEYSLINGYILDEPAYVRGNGHNNMQWTIVFADHQKLFAEGKN